MSDYRTFSADGYTTGWDSWNGNGAETLNLRWENEGWTASGKVTSGKVEYVIRLSPLWEVRQFLLFRDLDEPDLWLGTDGHGRWGEINGAYRTDLDGANDIHLSVSPFPYTIPIRRLPISVGQSTSVNALVIDVETLGVVNQSIMLERLQEHKWQASSAAETVEFSVDDYGLPLDLPGRFRRHPR